jgi:hypothetical protein
MNLTHIAVAQHCAAQARSGSVETRGMKWTVYGALFALMTLVQAAQAQMPSADEMALAVQSVQVHARTQGMVLRSGGLWLTALKARTPLVAAYDKGVCLLGYTAYTPGRDYGWLFPAMPPSQRALWLTGVLHHELAHCAERAHEADPAATAPSPASVDAPPEALIDGQGGLRWHEVLADLAFALHVDAEGRDGEVLIRQLAALRANQRDRDPAHDSSAELHCFLSQRDPLRGRATPWLETLKSLRARCFAPDS